MLHRSQKLRCEMQREVHFDQNISEIEYLSRIYQDDVCDINITSHYFT
jgi:hypothetical protein